MRENDGLEPVAGGRQAIPGTGGGENHETKPEGACLGSG